MRIKIYFKNGNTLIINKVITYMPKPLNNSMEITTEDHCILDYNRYDIAGIKELKELPLGVLDEE